MGGASTNADAAIGGVDVDAYCQRIGYQGPRTPTLDTLRAVVAAHTQAIPFENLDVLLGVPIALDSASLQRKLVLQSRGGYCFEHNTLLAAVLRALGFEVTGLAARVLLAGADAPLPPRTHMLLRVEADAHAWLVDAGFGRQTPTAPLPLRSDITLPTTHDEYRLVPQPHGLALHVREHDAWQPLYRFSGERQEHIDYEMANFFVSQWPASHFRRLLMMSRATRDGRHALLDNRHSFRPLRGAVEHRTLATAAELRQVVCDVMGLAPPEGAAFEALLVRMAASPAL